MDGSEENGDKIFGSESQVSNCSAIFSQETHRYLLKDLYDFASTLLSQGDAGDVETQYQVHGSEVGNDMQYSASLPRSQGFLRHEELNIQTDSYIIRPECGYENYVEQEYIPQTQNTSDSNCQENISVYNNALLTHVRPNQPFYSSQFSQNSNENYILRDFNLNDPINNLRNLNSPMTLIESETFPQTLKQETTPRVRATSSNAKVLRDLPSNVSLPGQYGFQFFINEINEKNVNKKAISYTFSSDKNKLYIRVNDTCPVNFKVQKPPPALSYIRAMAIYGKPQDLGEAVKRCMTHVDKDKETKFWADKFWIYGFVHVPDAIKKLTMCQKEDRQFDFDLRLNQIEVLSAFCHTNLLFGQSPIKARIDSLDFNRCSVLIGAEKIDRVTTLTSVVDPAPKRRMIDATPSCPSNNDDDSEIFTVQIRGRELYKIVQTIVQNFEIARNVSELAALRSSDKVRNGRLSTTLPSSLSPIRITGDDENNEIKTPKQRSCTILKRQNSQLQHQNLEQLIGRLSQEKKFCGSSSISSWLEAMSMQKYIPHFESNGLHQMEQLKLVSHEKLRSIGIENSKDLDHLYESIVRFKLARELGESPSSFGYSSQQQGIGPAGLHISRTTVKHSYKFDTGEN